MKYLFLLLLAVFNLSLSFSQNSFIAIIKDSESKTPIIGSTAVLKGTTNGSISDINGKVEIKNVPDSIQTIVFKLMGYEEQERQFTFPLSSNEPLEILLKAEPEELEEVIVQSTRTSRTIERVPTRVETIELEEIEEKSNMRPSNISMLLHESTGIQVQQTSATSANASIRIQGLDGKYTQLLKDGYPNFGGFASGLSVLEIPPLDLKQAEVIKGPASTLFGGGAIAGVVNFISKTPNEKPERLLLLNQSHIGQTNIGGFVSGKNKKIGYTFLGLVNFQKAYDVDKDDFTELPKSEDYTLNPKVFFYLNDRTTLILGNSFTKGTRIGGDRFVIEAQADTNHTYFERNKTLRNSSTIELKKIYERESSLNVRSSFSYFDRSIEVPFYSFSGKQYNSYTEAVYSFKLKKHDVITGINLIFDDFKEKTNLTGVPRNQATNTQGIFVQDTWDVTKKFSFESGLRLDNVNYSLQSGSENELIVLPRISALFKWSHKLTSRLGGGMGYKSPTLFTEQAEAIQYQNIQRLNNVKSERSYGGTADLDFKTSIGKNWFFSINQMFFYSQIQSPMILVQETLSSLKFLNADKSIESRGFETNAKLSWNDVKLYTGYTYTDAKANYQKGNQKLVLIPLHKVNLALLYENAKILKIGLEGYYSSKQLLTTGNFSRSFWEFGAMIEKPFKHFSIYFNAENFTDIRQNKYERVVNPPHDNPTFKDIWTHTEGRVFSGGIKVKF